MSLNLKIQSIGDFLFASKPQGLIAPRASRGDGGLIEILKRELGAELQLAYPLDPEISGTLVFCKTQRAAKQISELIQKQKVQRTYHFITDRVSTKSKLQSPHILFEKINQFHKLSLWRISTQNETGDSLRRQAQEWGLAILGDTSHGGSPYPLICLHGSQVEFTLEDIPYHFETTPPYWTQIEKIEKIHPLKNLIEQAFERRHQLFDLSTQEPLCLRRLHHEFNPQLPRLRIDQFGPVLWTYWYQETEPTTEELEVLNQVRLELNKSMWIRKMNNRGSDPNSNTLWALGDPPHEWTAFENAIQYQFSKELGLSPGLFLDLRTNREWVHQNAAQKKVLNLFSYTGGFSLAAALGKASEVVSLDLSKTFLEWSQRNFRLNQLEPQNFEFWNQDTFLFLKGCQKRNRKFDLIICDPPSFSRGKKSLFSIEKDLESLLTLCWNQLETGGKLLFSSNFEKWDKAFFNKKIRQFLPSSPLECLELTSELPFTGLDIELPSEPSLTKSFLFQRLR